MPDLSGSSVPGQAVPGALSPGIPAGFPGVTWQFCGTERLYYLQYLGPDGHVLSPAPGDTFAAGAITVASGQPYQLSDPPADGRWITF
jgi:hypothetical protein